MTMFWTTPRASPPTSLRLRTHTDVRCAARSSAPDDPAAAHRLLACCIALALAALSVMYFASVRTLVEVWLRSATFAHGFLIAPLCAWLVWRRRAHWRHVAIGPSLLTVSLTLPLLAAIGALWLLAMLADVPVVHQYCLVLLAIVTVVAIGGAPLGRPLSFPLACLLLAVPFGEVFTGPLIDFTAGFCAIALQALGIPVFRDNNYLTLPTGTWSVVEACSGLRYLVASLAMGVVYAYITYHSAWRRLTFIAVSLLVPVVANGLRATSIIMLGHYSDMRLALGIDHLIYGWFFFGLISMLLFWSGGRWRQADLPSPEKPMTAAPSGPGLPGLPGRLVATTAAVVALCAIWPALARVVTARDASPASAIAPARPLRMPAPPAPWTAAPLTAADWQPLYQGQPQRWSANYRTGADADATTTVSLQLAWYAHQRGQTSLLAPVARSASPGVPQWHETPAGQRDIAAGGRRFTVRQSIEQSADTKLLVWRWYWTPGPPGQRGRTTASPVLLKLTSAGNRLLGRDDSAAEIVVASPCDDDPAPAARAMADFIGAMLPAIEQGLHDVAGR